MGGCVRGEADVIEGKGGCGRRDVSVIEEEGGCGRRGVRMIGEEGQWDRWSRGGCSLSRAAVTMRGVSRSGRTARASRCVTQARRRSGCDRRQR